MNDIIFHFIFIVVSLFILIKTIFYGVYEIKTEKNKSGGISVIVFSVFVVLFCNVVVFFY